MIFADHLSRNVQPIPSNEPTLSNLDLEISVLELNASPSKLQLIKQESDRDPQLLMLKKYIIQGWPKDIKQCPSPIKSFWNFRDELSIVDGIVVKGNRIVIPLKYQPELLSLLHDDSHLGIDNRYSGQKAVYTGQTLWTTLKQWSKNVINAL